MPNTKWSRRHIPGSPIQPLFGFRHSPIRHSPFNTSPFDILAGQTPLLFQNLAGQCCEFVISHSSFFCHTALVIRHSVAVEIRVQLDISPAIAQT
jgi:hypothetical protein